jgi:hypothetical protein
MDGHSFNAAIVPAAPVLALLGDICTLTNAADLALYDELLRWCAARWELVIVLTGNHEYYNRVGGTVPVTMDQADAELARLCAAVGPNVVVLQGTGTSIDINGIRVLGATLWSELPTAEVTAAVVAYMQDYRTIYVRGSGGIEQLTGAMSTLLHRQTVAWLTHEIEQVKAPGKIVVLTHHAPSFERTSDPFFDGTPTTHGFASDLTHLFRPQIRLWGFGHTHFNTDQVHPAGTRVVANQKGHKWAWRVARNFKVDAVWSV